MAEQLVDRLINAVDNLPEETRRQNANASGSQVLRANRQSSQSTESEMRRLYPSINSKFEIIIILTFLSALSRASRPCQKERRLWVRDWFRVSKHWVLCFQFNTTRAASEAS